MREFSALRLCLAIFPQLCALSDYVRETVRVKLRERPKYAQELLKYQIIGILLNFCHYLSNHDRALIVAFIELSDRAA